MGKSEEGAGPPRGHTASEAESATHGDARLFSAVFAAASDAMVLAGDDGRYIDANPAACELFGLPKEELIGRTPAEFADPAYVATRGADAWRTFHEKGRLRAEFPLLRKDGTRRILDGSAVANVLPGVHLSVLRDVTERIEAERARHEAEQRLRTVLSNAPLILFALDRDGIFTQYEGKGIAAMGFVPGARIGESIFARLEVVGLEAAVRRALAGEEVNGTFVTLAKSTFDCVLVPVRDEGGAVSGVTGIALEVTARAAAESAMRISEARFRAMIEHGAEAIWLLAADGTITYASPSTRRALGFEPSEVLGKSALDLVIDEDRAHVHSERDELLKDPSCARVFEFRMRGGDGSVRWLEATSSNLLAEPAVGALVSNFRDVTARKLAEAAVSEGKRLLEEAQAVAHVGSWTSGGRASEPINWSRECAQIFGRDVGSPPTVAEFFEMVHPDDRAAVIAASERAVAEGTACETQHRIVMPNGEVRWVYARARIQGDVRWTGETASVGSGADGSAYGALGVVQDITERKRTEDELRASEVRYRRIVENTSEGVWVYDAAGITTFLNRRMAEMLGTTVAEALGKPIYAFIDQAGRGEAEQRVARRKRGVSERGEFRLTRPDGVDLWVALHSDPLFDSAGRFESSLVLATDITERRSADELRRRLAAIVESSDDAIISRDTNGVIRTWNHGAEKLTLYSAEEAVGKSITMLYPPEHAAERSRDRGQVDEGASLHQYEMDVVRKDGSRIEVSLTSSSLMDEHGKVSGASIIARDITAQRMAEAALRKSEEQLRQAQKMEAIGSLAGGVAHDFNNLLSIILSYTGLMLEDLKSGDPLRTDVEEVQSAGMRATALTRQLLAFSRKQMLQPVVLDVNQVVAGLQKMLGRLLGEDIDLTFLPSSPAGKVLADEGQLEQVLMNLAVNARDAMPAGGSLTIESTNVTVDDAYAAAHAGLAPGAYVMIAVTDTGVGMEAAIRDRVFEPFFTTKDKSKGTGLGLSTVYGIVQQSGGHVSVYSEPGHGTTFKVYLPRTDRPMSAVAVSAAPTSSVEGTETILLVEDEEHVRTVMRTILRRHGYHVLEAQNGGEAFLLCEQFTAKIHLLLTDVVMPRMSGRQLAERLEPIRPEMKVLYVSGYTENTVVHHGVLDAGIDFLQKPILPDALLRKVRHVLDAATLR